MQRHNDATAETVEDLVKVLEDNTPSNPLKSLVMDGALLKPLAENAPLFRRLRQALPRCHQLERIALSPNCPFLRTMLFDQCNIIGNLPSLKHVELDSSQCRFHEVLPSSLISNNNNKSLLSLQLTKWQINANALVELFLLQSLTLTNCRWDDSTKRIAERSSTANLALGLASNTHLQSLVLDDTRLSLDFFQHLPHALAKNHTLTRLTISNCNLQPTEMSHLLEALQRNDSLQEICVPTLMGYWTKSLQHQLESVLATGKDRFRSLQLHMQAVPATSIHGTNNSRSSERNQVWGIWKEFISSSTIVQEVTTSNLTEAELLDLVDLIPQQAQGHAHQQTGQACRWKKLRIRSDGVLLTTMVQLIHRLNSKQSTIPALQIYLDFTLFQGEELCRGNSMLAQLAKAITNNYLVNELALKTSEHSPCASFNYLTMQYDDEDEERKSVTTIRSVMDLNLAGRRYILQDSSNKAIGLSVLGDVSHNLDALFIHLRENPSLCKTHYQACAKEQRRGKKRKCADCLRLRACGAVETGLVLCCCAA